MVRCHTGGRPFGRVYRGGGHQSPAQAITHITALVIGLDQIGIDVSFLTTMLGISSAALLFGFAPWLSAWARAPVSNLVAAHHLRMCWSRVLDIRMGRLGRYAVLEVSSTAVILDTEARRVSVPAQAGLPGAGVVLLLADAGRGDTNLLSLAFLQNRPAAAAALLPGLHPGTRRVLREVPLEVLIPVIDGMASWPARTLGLMPVELTADVAGFTDAEAETMLRPDEQRAAQSWHRCPPPPPRAVQQTRLPISTVGMDGYRGPHFTLDSSVDHCLDLVQAPANPSGRYRDRGGRAPPSGGPGGGRKTADQ